LALEVVTVLQTGLLDPDSLNPKTDRSFVLTGSGPFQFYY
jgi:hypothetical protein